MTNRKFRSTLGLDSAGEKVVNVALADRNTMTDGVNVEYVIQENTLQQYDPSRGYLKYFAAIYDNRIWVANRDIPKPAGTFAEPYWNSIRVDPKWKLVQSGNYPLLAGDYISVDTDFGADMTFELPMNPQDGTTIVLKDIGGRPGYNKFSIISNSAANSHSMLYDALRVRSIQVTHAYAEVVLVFSNRLWNVYIGDHENKGRFITPASKHLAQSNERLIRRYTSAEMIRVGLPRNANHGDIIYFTDLEGKNPQYHLEVTTFDNNSSIGQVGTRLMEFRTSGDGFLIYDASEQLWRIWDGDLRTRLRIIRDDVNLVPNEHVMVFGVNNTTQKTININLPEDVAIGDTIRISLNYMRKGQIVNINAIGDDTIASSVQLLQFPKRSEYPPETNWVQVKTLTFNGTTAYVPVIELSYIEDSVTGEEYWVVADNNPTVERVDALNNETRKRLGVIALASQAQANANHEQNPEKELAITPETLANRTATETRRGIARLATTAEVVQDSTYAFLDDIIVTPKKLNQRTATETRRGLAEIATQAETNAGTDDSTIITPKKLEARRATETMAGIAPLVASGGVPGINRDTVGTGIYERTEHTKQVTPKTLFENKATQTAQGGVWLATGNEVIAAPVDDPAMPLAVTPEQLHKKTATETRIGFSEIATQAETNAGTDDFRFVTPKKLNDRKSTETLDGIARIATQAEFDAGTANNLISTPLKIKTRFNSTSRTTVDQTSGLRESGTLWDTHSLNIVLSTETQRGTTRIATQAETNAGTDDATTVTPKKLGARKSTEALDGIIRLGTQAEVVTGTANNLAVSPVHLKYVMQTESTWQATPTRRGPVKITEGALTWVGTNVLGSTKPLDDYEKNGYAISPYEFNKTLANYLPLMATAENSRNLGGFLPSQYIRRDIDQTVTGSLTLTKQTNISAPVISTDYSKFKYLIASEYINIGESSASSTLSFNTTNNVWGIKTLANTDNIQILGGSTAVLTAQRDGNVSVAQTLTANNRVEAVKGISVEGGTIVINPTPSTIVLGTQSKAMTLYSPNASAYNVIDPSGTYQLLTTKNNVAVNNVNFVNRAGSSMSGELVINNVLSVVLSEATAFPSLTSIPNSSNKSAWTAEITSAAKYNLLPGYAVPILGKTTNEQGEEIETGIVVDYKYFNGPGTLTQHGNGTTGIYQIWAPRPAANQANHNAQTFWIRNFNKVLNKWDGFARMFTSDMPPTASDLGAVSQTGGRLNNLTIRDWFQIGNVRLRPNPDTRTLEFEWVN
ncbi:tail fiber protein proximal subunit [Pseudomonas phage PspYZU05]|uniref:Long-tail fiber proximal subunit domain-containing protein n=1 Tax=Pseudomonas phage PspYZU05 TaxID=1983556 RepID=A0A2U7N8D6_9CAUD|nr:tail fiber protein proximal subunit [Pseudomonas phage PspYZU05]ASD52113.1 hypothetical protein PspYZU05_161 [Pseudomonas phage PspYZU05]